MSEPLPAVGSSEYWNPWTYLPHLSVKHTDRTIRKWKPWSHLELLNAAVLRAYSERKGVMHLKARREGSTTYFTGVAYQHASTLPGTWAALLGFKRDSANSMSEMVMRFHRTAPEAWRPAHRPGKKRELYMDGIDSKVTAHSVKDEEPLRGDGVHFLLANEISSWQDSKTDDAWVAARSALSKDGGFLVADSTGIREGDPMHQLWQEGDEPGAPWVKCFIPWTLVERYAKDPPAGWVPHPLVDEYRRTHVITDAQAYWMHSVGLPDCKYNLGKFMAEYPYTDAEPFMATGGSIFDAVRLMRMLHDIDGGTSLAHSTEDYQEFVPPQRGHLYVIGVDPAGSWAERDFYGAVVIDVTTCEVVAEWWGHGHAYIVARRLMQMSTRYSGGVRPANLYIEANAIGEGVLAAVTAMGYPHIYWRKERGSKPKPGWWSSMKSKAEALGAAQSLVEDGSIYIPSPRVIKQLLGMRGIWGARDERKGHYDLGSAFCIAAWAYTQEMHMVSRRSKVIEIPPDTMILGRFHKNLLASNAGSASGHAGRMTRWGTHR